MIETFKELPAPIQAMLGGTFTWLVTLPGSLLVLARRDLPAAVMDAMAGFAAGVMIAASFWSLLAPAIEIAGSSGGAPAWVVATGGFILGALFLRLVDRVVPHLHPRMKIAEGPHAALRKSTLLWLAMTIHNVPEGLAVGVAFGAAASGTDFALGSQMGAALALTLGIGLQNLPEGIAVAMPMRKGGLSRWKAFHAGHLSAIVEPFAALVGAWLVIAVQPILPWALAFAAGAMIFVAVEELIPDSQRNGRADLAALSTIAGFSVMMMLDVALG